ncbi:MAG TPA: MFS transporter [Erysipelotrichaceae bacterium]|nr:MAG: MFS transporter [Firmicutes bacterium GWE2_51_13]HBZ40284.1 MFS transporter [Erysipelotrichaceae bacterium]
MRRSDREVSNQEEIKAIIDRCVICRVAMVDDGKPYLVPLNFGYTLDQGTLTLVFHSAKSGRKIDILRRHPDVCFEMDCDHALIDGERACDYSFAFSSVIGNGKVEFIEDETLKREALKLLMKRQTGKEDFEFSPHEVQGVCVFTIVSEDFSAKRKMTTARP